MRRRSRPRTRPGRSPRQKALAAHVRLEANPELFDSIARAESDEGQANGVTGSGGKLPFFDSKSQVDPAFLQAITAPGLKDGQLLEPVKSAFGWHVIQVMYHPTEADHMAALKKDADGGDNFAVIARDNSVAQTAGAGGDLGWVAKYQLDPAMEAAIFATPVGKTSDPIEIPDDGHYLFKVWRADAPAGRRPEGDLDVQGIHELVRGQEDRGRDRQEGRSRPADGLTGHRPCSTRCSPRRGSDGASTSATASRSCRRSG